MELGQGPFLGALASEHALELSWNYRGTIPELSRNYAETVRLHYVFTDSSEGSSCSLCP